MPEFVASIESSTRDAYISLLFVFATALGVLGANAAARFEGPRCNEIERRCVFCWLVASPLAASVLDV